jgi:hypothetical protein
VKYASDVTAQVIARMKSEKVRGMSTAAAIEEQSTVTSEMSSGMQRAAEEAASIGQAA